MEPVDSAFEAFKERQAEIELLKDTLHSEEDVRLKVINPILHLLGWNDANIRTEESAGPGFIDYKLTIDGRTRLIVEAKKDGRDLGVSEDKAARYFKLNGSVLKTEHVKEGIEQAIRYAGHKNAELAAVTNGRQWVIFRANRLGDGKDTLDGMACVFGSLEKVKDHFETFFDLLSYDAVEAYKFRALFQQAEGEPIQASSFCECVRPPASRNLLPADKLFQDIDRVMASFFRQLADPELRRGCFVSSPESEEAEARLARISEDLINKVQTIETTEGAEIVDVIERVEETQIQAFGLLVGTKGAGKSTFLERFFEDILPRKLASRCIVINIDVSESDGDESRIVKWLSESLLQKAEATIFDGDPPTYDQLQGMYFDQYKRLSEGPRKHLYTTDRTAFKIKFGEELEQKRNEAGDDYTVRMLQRAVRSENRIPCLIFDNADHFTIEFQERVFQFAQSIYNRVICMVLVPITDKTSWQLSRQGALQSFYSETFFLPTPPPQDVLLKRIQFIQQMIDDEENPEKGTGYFMGRGLPLELGDLRTFVNQLQELFIRSGDVAKWIGNLSNNDIRRCLKLTRETVSSPHIPVHGLLKTYVEKSTLYTDNESTRLAIVNGKYDIYPAGQHEFVQNIYALYTEFRTSPLIGLRILRVLNDARHIEADGESTFIQIDSVIEYMRQMGFSRELTQQWLNAMLRCALCLSYDPTATSIEAAARIEISPSGIQHLTWGTRDWIYIESMLKVTPIIDRDVYQKLTSLTSSETPATRRNAISTFLRYLLDEDARYTVIPDHDAYSSQNELVSSLNEQIDRLAGFMPIRESVRYGREKARVLNWNSDKGFGFARLEGQTADVFVHCSEIEGHSSLNPGDVIMCDVVDGKEGKPKAIDVARIS